MNNFYPEGLCTEKRTLTYSAAELENAMASGEILEGVVRMCDASHNLFVDLGSMTGIIKREEGALGIDTGATRDIALISRVGKIICFIVEDILLDSNKKPYAVLSRKKAQKLGLDNFLNTAKNGDIINAKITHLESFGAFCDIGCGNIALLPIDSISVSRISHPKDRFSVGDNIKAIVKYISDDGKITLSHKELLGTWEENANLFSAGQTVSGIVRSVENYGIFVEIAPNLAGLAEPKENISVGKAASVYIKSIIKEKMKIKLIIIDTSSQSYSPEIKYFYDKDSILEWDYSPPESKKRIFTKF